MIIDHKKIANDISTNDEIYNKFLQTFPNNKQHIDEVKKSPRCGGCLVKNLTPLLEKEETKPLLISIYGAGNEFQLVIPKPPVFKPEHIVEEIDPEQLNDYLRNNLMIEPGKRMVQLFDTHYNSRKNKTIVSAIVLTVEQQA